MCYQKCPNGTYEIKRGNETVNVQGELDNNNNGSSIDNDDDCEMCDDTCLTCQE